ncbi:right-handed parallel beta-helix repeat-containing protein [Methanobrevibacter sp.]
MKYRKGMILSMLVIFLFCIAGACASDVNDTQAASMDDSGIELTATDNDFKAIDYDNVTTDGETLSAGNDGPADVQNDLDKLRANPGTYSQLSSEIGSGGNVELQHDYYSYDSGSTIVVTQANSVIDGRGAVIDMAGSGIRALHVSASGVTIRNLTIMNVNAHEYGGAIYFSGEGSGTVENCNFTNNSANNGGAVYFNCNGRLTNCSFIDNEAIAGGAVLWNCADGVASSCIFINNSADNGIIYFDNAGSGAHLIINDNIFLRNEGKAISFAESDGASNADFNWFGNTKDDFNEKPLSDNVDIDIWLFLDAKSNPDIFPISTASEITFSLYAYDSNEVFGYDNSRLKPVKLTITPVNGQVNATNVELAKTILYTESGEGADNLTATIENVSFTVTLKIADGTTFWDLNNAINANSNDTITLDRNYAYNPITDYDFKDGIIINRMVTIIGGDYSIDAKGQARIFNIHADKVTIRNVTFINANATDYGGALYWNGVNVTVFDCLFVNNSAGISGGAIYWRDGADTNVSGCIFVNNTAENGGAVTVGDGVVSGCSFVNNTAEYGGAVILAGGIVSDCSFVNNSAYNCGAVSLENGVVSHCSFINNTAVNSGGAIVWSNAVWSSHTGNVSDCSFVNNRAGSGGAILWEYGANGIVSDCIFVNNFASVEGGAILWAHNDNANISGCSFVNNTAGSDGGAIYLKFSANGVVYDCIFVNNSARYGGAIEWHQSDNGNISTCIFVNNSDERAVIFFYNMGSGHGLSINNNIFLNNSADAISFVLPDSSSNADYNWFGNNATDYETQPATSNVAISNWLFLNATATPDSILIFQSSDIIFRLHSYSESEGVSDYDNSKLPEVNLTLKATKGNLVGIAKLDELIRYFAMDYGTGTVTGKIENAQYTVEITNEKADLNLSVETSQVTYSHNTLISLSYNPNATGKVNITLKSKRFEYTFVDVDLNATLSLGDIAADEYEIIIRYSGDSLFTNSTAAADLKVDKANSTLTANNVTLDYGTGTTVTVTTDGTLAITAIINGEETFVKGSIILIPTMDAGTYNLTVTAIPDENHNAVTKTVTITVNRLKTQIAANAVTATYNINKYLTITLKDAKGKALGGVKVTVNLNGAKTYTTDKNGQIKISTKGLAPKTYTAKIAFGGNKNYLKSSKNAKITVKKAKAKLTAKSKKFKRSKKVKKYTVVLKSNVGKPLKKVKLTIKIKGKKYKKTFKAKTNKKGKATFKIKKLTRKGKYRAVITYKGNKYYTKMTKKVKITVK